MNNQRQYGALKRKERESSLPPAKRPPPPPPPPRTTVPASTRTTNSKIEIRSTNKLLAGYMAYEFLTKGRLLGQKLDGEGSDSDTTAPMNGKERYEQVTSLLMMTNESGDHISGIVNPTELDRWIGMN